MTAIKMFATHGFAATSIRNLAAEAEVHIGSVGHYFGGKDQLFWTARRHAINKLERETSELHPDSEEQLVNAFFQITKNFSMELKLAISVVVTDDYPKTKEKLSNSDKCPTPPGLSLIRRYLNRSHLGAKDILERLLLTVFHHQFLRLQSRFINDSDSPWGMSEGELKQQLSHLVGFILNKP